MKPLALLLTLMFVSGCAAASVPAPPPPAPPQPQVAVSASASQVERLVVGNLQQEQDGVLVVPPVTTVVAVAPAGVAVVFFATAGQGPVRQLGQVRSRRDEPYSLTFTVPTDLGPVLTVWAALADADTATPVRPADGTPSVQIRSAPAGSKLADLGGFSLFPAFNWHTQLTEQERQEIAQWQGAGWEQGADLIAYSGRLFDISSAQVLQWSMAEGEQAGWQGLGPAGGGASWGMVGARNNVKVRVNFALGLGGGPPLRPELGYGMLVRVYK